MNPPHERAPQEQEPQPAYHFVLAPGMIGDNDGAGHPGSLIYGGGSAPMPIERLCQLEAVPFPISGFGHVKQARSPALGNVSHVEIAVEDIINHFRGYVEHDPKAAIEVAAWEAARMVIRRRLQKRGRDAMVMFPVEAGDVVDAGTGEIVRPADMDAVQWLGARAMKKTIE